jgi:hypothetical protein
MIANRFRTHVTVSLGLLTMMAVAMALANQPIDWQRAQELLRRERQGQTLNEQDEPIERANSKAARDAGEPAPPAMR